MRKIKLVELDNKNYIYINRGVNNFLFTQNELSRARKRYDKYKGGHTNDKQERRRKKG